MVGVRLGEELESRLFTMASALKRAKSSLIREAIEAKLEEWEDMSMILESYHDKGRRWTLDELINRDHASADGLAD